MKTLNQKDTIEKGMFKIKKLWRGEPKCFGSGYCISITNTVVETDSESSLVEYLVFFNVLVELARKVFLFFLYIPHFSIFFMFFHFLSFAC